MQTLCMSLIRSCPRPPPTTVSALRKDPLTGHEVSPEEVFPNLAMYAVLEEYVREQAPKLQQRAAAAEAEGEGVAA